jgi:hypothetical protein
MSEFLTEEQVRINDEREFQRMLKEAKSGPTKGHNFTESTSPRSRYGGSYNFTRRRSTRRRKSRKSKKSKKSRKSRRSKKY